MMDRELRKDLITRISSLSQPLEPDTTGIEPELAKIKNLRAVVFDVYGTMFISGTGDISLADDQDSTEVIEKALAGAGFRIQNDKTAAEVGRLYEQAVTQFMNRRKEEGIDFPEVDIIAIWTEVLEALTRQDRVSGAVNDKTVRQFSVEYECRANPVWPMPGLPEVLQKIREKDLDLGIVSNSQFYTPLMFDAMLGKSIEELGFHSGLCIWSYKHLIGKPSLMLYEKLVEALEHHVDYSPDQVLYVGNDMLKDIYPADKLGFNTAFFTGDSRSYKPRERDARCEGLKPTVTLSRLQQVLNCI